MARRGGVTASNHRLVARRETTARLGVQGILLVLLLPVIVMLVAYGVAWSIGLAEFIPPGSSTFPAVTHPLARLGLEFISIVSALWFMAMITAAAFLYARFRLVSGSIWPVIILHEVWNNLIEGVFDASTSGVQAKFWVGESGVLVMQ